MPRSTKKTIGISLGNTEQERDARLESLREIASECGYQGRYGGNLSELICAIADLPKSDRLALAVTLKKFLGKG